ncbi:MBL fold metallo-hydrolase [Jeotgalibacillus campisalis]|uniref:Metallo-beta-lactamase domain-containing protein n=1 Tax=Jeotgalibacillus campisalis TaxID=220754 RepID=A0A0C2VEY6_9BACL|nr:MBL fold metallo-hydrolase [Jeotgalibacillus campisalis]KIL43076.1 hypothetical protein KR50_34790 [Jeotgalibacillus campisalis]
MTYTLTVYGGVNTIGGVHVLLSNGKKGFLFDLGVTWAWGLFGGRIVPDAERALQHYLLTRLAPPLPSVFKKDLVQHIPAKVLENLWKVDELPELESITVFVSHIHQDHMALLPYVNKETKVYMHRDAHSVYKAVAESGEYAYTEAEILPLDHLDSVQLDDDFSFQLVDVDHDTPGASGLLITLGEYNIAFTGDWRLHGRHPERMERFAQLCSETNTDILLTEGTSLRKETYFTEPVMRQEKNVVKEFGKMSEGFDLLYVNILARNVERVADFIVKAKELGRKLVMDERTALLWKTATEEGISTLPSDHPARMNEKDVICLLDLQVKSTDLVYNTVTMEDIWLHKNQYIVFLTEEQTPLLSEFETLGDSSGTSLYFHADGNPLNKEDPILHRWLKLYNIHYHYYGTGGHASPEDISQLIETVSPKVAIPLHSLNPSLVNTKNAVKYCPSYGEKISIQALLGKQSETLV